ncbi:MAG: metal-dependent hydrolase, partial [Anaerolineae bacterium]
MVGISDWLGLGLALYSLAVTLLTFWLALRWWGRGLAVRLWSWWIVAGNLLWSAILFAGSVIAARYFQRLESALYVAVAYAAAALAGFFLSLLRARLRLRAVTTGSRPASGLSRNEIMHNAAYLLLALVLLLLFSWPGGGPASPILLIPLFIGALLPDLDARDSLAGRLLPGVSRPVESWLGHKGAWHTPAAAAGLAIVTLPLALFPAAGPGAWYPLPLGFASHLLLDLLEPRGIMLLWPLSRSRYRFPWTPLRAHGGPLERRLVTALGVVALLLLLVVGLGPESPPPAAPAPSYEQTLERYHSLRGRYLVFGYVQGTWQSSGLRLGARFEVLNASGTSYVLLDRYTGKVFSAGHDPADDVYLDSISLQTGSQVQVKPAEIVLQGQPLAGGLDVLYEMQREPGLQYIYVFGKVLLPEGVGSGLPVDQTLTGIPRIYREASG